MRPMAAAALPRRIVAADEDVFEPTTPPPPAPLIDLNDFIDVLELDSAAIIVVAVVADVDEAPIESMES